MLESGLPNLQLYLYTTNIAVRWRENIEESIAKADEVRFDEMRGDCNFTHTIRPLYDPAGTVRHLVLLGVDITEQIPHELEVSRTDNIIPHEDFDNHITASAKEMAKSHQALLQANKKLNRLGKITRHDLLNYLTNMNGFLWIAQHGSTTEEIAHSIANCADIAKSIHETILFTRNYQDLGLKGPTWHSIRQLLSLTRSISAVDRVRVKDEMEDYEIYADTLITKIFPAILNNSYRHAGPSLSIIRFSTDRVDERLRIICEDDGQGVPEEEKSLIFNYGYGKSSELGLFLFREILSITKIEIIESGDPGKGARFEILVPEGMWRKIGG